MKNAELFLIKEIFKQGMIRNFEKDGHLQPIIFFYMKDNPMIIPIPSHMLSSPENKHILAATIKQYISNNPVLAAGIIIEAYGAIMDKDNELSKLITSGDITVSELKEKQDIIIMVFSSPEGDDVTAYLVDVKNKKVGEPFINGKEMEGFGGTFSGFFDWNKN